MHWLVLIVCWVDVVLILGREKALEHLSTTFQDSINSENLRDLKECLDWKIDREGDFLHIAKPVLVEWLKAEFKFDGMKTRGIQMKLHKCYVRIRILTSRRMRWRPIGEEYANYYMWCSLSILRQLMQLESCQSLWRVELARSMRKKG